jgi:hypothetical protein
MKLIPEARKAWRMFSVQAQAVALAVLGAWQVMPEDLKTNLPQSLVYWLSMGLMVLGIVGRLIDQPKVRE